MNALPVLMYHHVSPNPGLVTLSPNLFRQQMEGIVREGWRTIGTADIEAFFDGQPLPKKSLMITFDDGYLDNFIYAYPVLKELGLQAVLFIVSGWIGDGSARQTAACPDHSECKRRIALGETDSVVLRWSEVEQMRDTGIFEFHSHTHSHSRWDKTLADGDARFSALQEDLQRSRIVIKERLGIVDRHLCWPQGYFQPEYVDIANRLGFDHLYTTQPTINRCGGDAREIGRVVVKEQCEDWLLRRLRVYASPWLGGIYTHLKGSR